MSSAAGAWLVLGIAIGAAVALVITGAANHNASLYGYPFIRFHRRGQWYAQPYFLGLFEGYIWRVWHDRYSWPMMGPYGTLAEAAAYIDDEYDVDTLGYYAALLLHDMRDAAGDEITTAVETGNREAISAVAAKSGWVAEFRESPVKGQDETKLTRLR